MVSPSHLGSALCYFRKVGIPGDLLFVDSKLLNERHPFGFVIVEKDICPSLAS